jgi:hypothetical protein
VHFPPSFVPDQWCPASTQAAAKLAQSKVAPPGPCLHSFTLHVPSAFFDVHSNVLADEPPSVRCANTSTVGSKEMFFRRAFADLPPPQLASVISKAQISKAQVTAHARIVEAINLRIGICFFTVNRRIASRGRGEQRKSVISGYEKVNIAGHDIGAEGGSGEHQKAASLSGEALSSSRDRFRPAAPAAFCLLPHFQLC